MDTSETYVKMCEKATEIQEGHPQEGVSGTWLFGHPVILCNFTSRASEGKCGDYYAVFDERGVRRCPTCGNEEEYIQATKSTWLPRQDQLQEMVLDDETDTLCLALNFSEWLKQRLWGNIECTFEQLWLAYVMWTKYKKKWNSEDWLTTSRQKAKHSSDHQKGENNSMSGKVGNFRQSHCDWPGCPNKHRRGGYCGKHSGLVAYWRKRGITDANEIMRLAYRPINEIRERDELGMFV